MEKQLKDFIGNVDECIALFKQKVERIENERAALQSKCDRYEKALKEIADQAKYNPGNSWADIAYIMKEKALNAIANEALNGEGGETICDCTPAFKAAHGECYKCPGKNQKENKQ